MINCRQVDSQKSEEKKTVTASLARMFDLGFYKQKQQNSEKNGLENENKT